VKNCEEEVDYYAESLGEHLSPKFGTLHNAFDALLVYRYLFGRIIQLIVDVRFGVSHPFCPTFNRLLLISQTEIIQIGHLLPLNLLQVL
jgi:hypothetical protein